MHQTISNFKPIFTNEQGIEFATVDVTTKKFLKKPEVKTVDIFKVKFTTYWKFVSTGKYTPDNLVENLESSYYMKQEIDKYNKQLNKV